MHMYSFIHVTRFFGAAARGLGEVAVVVFATVTLFFAATLIVPALGVAATRLTAGLDLRTGLVLLSGATTNLVGEGCRLLARFGIMSLSNAMSDFLGGTTSLRACSALAAQSGNITLSAANTSSKVTLRDKVLGTSLSLAMIIRRVGLLSFGACTS